MLKSIFLLSNEYSRPAEKTEKEDPKFLRHNAKTGISILCGPFGRRPTNLSDDFSHPKIKKGTFLEHALANAEKE